VYIFNHPEGGEQLYELMTLCIYFIDSANNNCRDEYIARPMIACFYFFLLVELQLARHQVQSSSVLLDYFCYSMYLTPINITISLSNGMQYTLPCGKYYHTIIRIPDVGCGKTINICGYASGSSNVICMVSSCIEFESEICPTTNPSPSPSPSPTPIHRLSKHALIQ
jgi:hypothetical protein